MRGSPARLRDAAGAAVAVGGRTVTQAGRDLGLSWPVVSAAFVDRATAMLPAEPEPVAALGIDETRRGRPRFALDPDTGTFEQITDRWHIGLCATRRCCSGWRWKTVHFDAVVAAG